MTITGVVDRVSYPDGLSGWAHARDDQSSPIEIYVTKDGHRISGTSVWGNPREWHWINDGKIGFYFKAEIPFSPELLSSGRIKIFANAGVHGTTELLFDDGMSRFLKAIETFAAGKTPPNFSTKDFAEIIRWISMTGVKLDGSWYEKLISAVDYSGQNLGKIRDIEAADTSSIRVPVGITSVDKSAIIAADGQALLIGGSNDVIGMYAPTDTTAANGNAWVSLIERRRKTIPQHTPYVHCIVPEKVTSLRHLTNFDLPSASHTAEIINTHFSQSEFYLSLFNVLDLNLDGWRKFDSHLSPRGALLVVNALLSALKLPQQGAPTFDRQAFTVGDLSTRFFDFPIYDTTLHPVDDMPAPELIYERPAHRSGGHIGIQMQWRNEKAPIKSKLFIAGNSFSGQGETACDLNWWLSRFFTEVFFDFNPALDVGLMQKFNPDFVVTQTIERFLNVIPEN